MYLHVDASGSSNVDKQRRGRWFAVAEFSLFARAGGGFCDLPFGQSQSAESIPDFSGIWVHANPGFEPLASGPTALVNRARRPNGTGDILRLAGDYNNPILKPEVAEVVKKHGELGMAGIGDPNPRNQCWPEGPPFVFTNGPTQLVQQKDKVTILYVYAHQVRQVRMNQQHPARVTPSWYGDSVGHYEGDTLVVDTVGIKVGRYSMVDWYGTPHTEALHVVERYRMLDYDAAKEGFERDAKQHNVVPGMPVPNDHGKYLQLRFTVDDKGAFTTPWTATMTYRNDPDGWVERPCAENLFWYPGKEGDIPGYCAGLLIGEERRHALLMRAAIEWGKRRIDGAPAGHADLALDHNATLGKYEIRTGAAAFVPPSDGLDSEWRPASVSSAPEACIPGALGRSGAATGSRRRRQRPLF